MSLVRMFYGANHPAYPQGHSLSPRPAEQETLDQLDAESREFEDDVPAHGALTGAGTPPEPASPAGPAFPAGRPESFWTLAQLNAWATDGDRHVILPEGLKGPKVEAAQYAYDLEQEPELGERDLDVTESDDPAAPLDGEPTAPLDDTSTTED